MRKRLIPFFKDEEFIRDKVPMTKSAVRHLSVLKLDLREGDTMYDIGCGTGSVACEAAAKSGSLRVYAIDMKPAACELTRRNTEHLGLNNVHVIEGKAPDAFEGLDAPDCVFIGGSSGQLMDIIDALSGMHHEIRMVLNAVSLETISEIQPLTKRSDVSGFEIEQISVSRSRELGNYHLMTAENPVIIASFTLNAAHTDDR